jgi:hypothetical protein
MRGRLIFPFLVEIAPIDTEAMAEDPDGDGPLTAGYHPVFREPVKLPSSGGEGPGTTNRKEGSTYRVPAQIEPISFDQLDMLIAGNSPNARFQLVMHFRDLENAGRVDATGGASVRVGDRLAAIYTMQEALVHDLTSSPLFVTEVRPIGFGLSMGTSRRNLLLIVLQDRKTGAPV